MNAPCSSHARGVWERQIRTIRSVLSGVVALCPGRLDDSSLRTLFYEAMAIVNSRPLSVDTINGPTSLEPLTPNNILTMKTSVPLPPRRVFLIVTNRKKCITSKFTMKLGMFSFIAFVPYSPILSLDKMKVYF